MYSAPGQRSPEVVHSTEFKAEMKLSYAGILSKLQNLSTDEVCMNALMGLCICMCVHACAFTCAHLLVSTMCVCVYWGNLSAVSSHPPPPMYNTNRCCGETELP